MEPVSEIELSQLCTTNDIGRFLEVHKERYFDSPYFGIPAILQNLIIYI